MATDSGSTTEGRNPSPPATDTAPLSQADPSTQAVPPSSEATPSGQVNPSAQPGPSTNPSSAQGDHLSREERALRKGLVVMTKVQKAKRESKKLSVRWNNKGQVVKSDEFISYIGYAARSNVPITLDNWKKVDPAMKQAVWEEVAVRFSKYDALNMCDFILLDNEDYLIKYALNMH